MKTTTKLLALTALAAALPACWLGEDDRPIVLERGVGMRKDQRLGPFGIDLNDRGMKLKARHESVQHFAGDSDRLTNSRGYIRMGNSVDGAILFAPGNYLQHTSPNSIADHAGKDGYVTKRVAL